MYYVNCAALFNQSWFVSPVLLYIRYRIVVEGVMYALSPLSLSLSLSHVCVREFLSISFSLLLIYLSKT